MDIRFEKREHLQEKPDQKNLGFGKHFTDYMFVMDWDKEQGWHDAAIVPYGGIPMDPATMVLHYAQETFEGMKAYRTAEGKIQLFRPEMNARRMIKSNERLCMPGVPEEMFVEAVKALVKAQEDWVPSEPGTSLYIRPFMIASEPALNAVPSKEYLMLIIGGPVDTIFHGEVKVKIADHFSRAANGGTGFAKCAGNYGGQFYPSTLASEEGYQSVIWTDDATHQFLEEAGQMNFMLRIGDTLRTAPVSERLLDGITRRSILQLAQDMGIKTEVSPISVQQVLDAADKGELKEAFGCGTAAVISPICGLGYKDRYMPLPELSAEESFGERLRQRIFDIQYNRTSDPYGWRVVVK